MKRAFDTLLRQTDSSETVLLIASPRVEAELLECSPNIQEDMGLVPGTSKTGLVAVIR